MNDFTAEYRDLQKELDDAIHDVLTSGWYILGKNVALFEQNFAQYIGSKHCIGVANGLDALQISLMSLGIGKGDEVITVSNTAVATVLAISNTGATPVFVDINDFYLIDTKKIEEKITRKTRAIIPVHLFGQMAEMKKLMVIAKKYSIHIVEDACQAHGAKQNGKMAGSFGITGCFSFYPTKNLGGAGDGGAIVTNDHEIYERAKKLRNYGQTTRYIHEIKGVNSRLDELQAAILCVKLRHINSFVKKRQEIATLYNERLSGISDITLPHTFPENEHSYHLYVIKTTKRDELMKYLYEKGIMSLIHYPVPVHMQACYPEYHGQILPNTMQSAEVILSIPIHPYLNIMEQTSVINSIHSFYS